jgi:hypothetical protein
MMSPDELDKATSQQELERLSKMPATAEAARAALKESQEGAGGSKREKRSRRENASKRIVNGLGTIGFPAAGALLHGADRRSATAWCSGTLIGCSTFLTAAHCIADDPDPVHYKVFFQHAGIFDVSAVHWQKDKFNFPNADVAILKLSQPVEGVLPLTINHAAKPISGSKGRLVGFGRTGGDRADYGIKRMGFVETSGCEPPRSDTALICWKYSAMIKAPGEDSNTCNGDSGGGLQIEGDQTIAGVTSGGKKDDCLGGDRSYDANVYEYRAWIDSVAGSDRSLDHCGALVDLERSVIGDTTRINETQSQRVYDISVPSGTAKLRVAMNGEDNGKNDFDLYLLKGQTTDLANPVCAEDGTGQFGFCEINDPAPGQWTILLRRKTGDGLVQTVVSMIPKAP